jgi:hypothetical protein
MKKDLKIIGSNAVVDLVGHAESIPAKIDTGADSSAIWASDIRVDKKGQLLFVLFDKSSQYYTGEVLKRKAFKVASVRSSTGHHQLRYRTELLMKVGRKRVRVLFNLSDRSSQHFPVLIGRRTLANKFLVNVSKKELPRYQGEITQSLNEEMVMDPYKFYKKYSTAKN